MTLEKQDTFHDSGFNPLLITDASEEWRAELQSAIQSEDEAAIWRIMNAQQLNADAHDALVDGISRHQYRTQNLDVYCELFMMPVILPGTFGDMTATNTWVASRDAIKGALLNWFSKRAATVIFEGIMPMSWVTSWRPRVIRQHLERLVPDSDRKSMEFQKTELELPAGSPRLGFVLIGCRQPRSWPEIPELNSLQDKRVKDVVKYAIQMAAMPDGFLNAELESRFVVSPDETPIVLTPERLQFAITDGIARWLMKLNESSKILGWVVTQSMKASDVVKFTLHLDAPDVRATQFMVRMHQIGVQGLSDLTIVLSSMAPNMETPADMTNEEFQAMQIPSVVA